MNHHKNNRATMNLISAVAEMFESELAKDTSAAPALKRVLALLPELRLDSERSEVGEQSVCRHLPRALVLGQANAAASAANAFRELEGSLSWVQNARYNAENMGADFMNNYAYSDLGLAGGTGLDFGALLLGPRVTYPLTSYPQEGVFVVIGGSPDWKCGDKPWARVEAGSVIWRPAGGAEGKRPGEEPLLALYAWLAL